MCYKACFYNGGHRRKNDRHIVIFARAYRNGKMEGEPIRKQQTENRKEKKPEGNLQTCKTCSISTPTHVRVHYNMKKINKA